MNKQVQTQTKRSAVLPLIYGSIVLLIGFLVYGYFYIMLSGQEESGGFELYFLQLFAVFPLLIIGVVLVVRGLLRQRSNVLVIVGVLLLIGPLTAFIVAASHPQSFLPNVGYYLYQGPVDRALTELLKIPILPSIVLPVLVIIGSCLLVVGLRGISQTTKISPTTFGLSAQPVQGPPSPPPSILKER